MGMDKERLFRYFSDNYLSRSEVLFRLPFNISVDSFWPELLDRRKANAVVLPLYGANGMPYWYVLTDRMVRASEMLCEMALEQSDEFDPYRVEMTGAMTEEMFFTSYVEGAQMDMSSAMAYLQSGDDPENIYEQMLSNNRQAWATMAQGLYHPLDEGFVRMLAGMLTEDMEDNGGDYRMTDDHEVLAMSGEEYDLPPAHTLPQRMEEFYSFLRKDSIHPLIKAAAGQAYILAARPFPDGNERLARMISSAVLLRSGYSFFRDVSISAVIARESYRYFKCMREIMRPENGNDLTYFIEYFLELLVRAMKVSKENAMQREKSAIEDERVLARQTLTQEGAVWYEDENPSEMTEERQTDSITDLPGMSMVEIEMPATENSTFPDPLPDPQICMFEATENVPAKGEEPHVTYDPSLEGRLAMLESSGDAKLIQIAGMVRKAIEEGFTNFASRNWGEHFGMKKMAASRVCQTLYKYGIADRVADYRGYNYTIVDNGKPLVITGGSEPPVQADEKEVVAFAPIDESPPDFFRRIEALEKSGIFLLKTLAGNIRRAVSEGMNNFCQQEWCDFVGIKETYGSMECNIMFFRGIVLQRKERHTTYYLFNIFPQDQEIPDGLLSCGTFEDRLRAMENSRSKRVSAAVPVIRRMISDGKMEYSLSEWQITTGAGRDTARTLHDSLLMYNISERVRHNSTKDLIYRFAADAQRENPECFLPRNKKRQITERHENAPATEISEQRVNALEPELVMA